MMETLAQTFVVAPSQHEEEHEEVEYGESDDDSASFYDEDDQSFDGEEEEGEDSEGEDSEAEEDDDDSEGSADQGGLFGTAKYFSGPNNMEPQMMGFSDSFVTDGDCSEHSFELGEQDFASNAFSPSPMASPHASGNLSTHSNSNSNSKEEFMEESVHEDVLSFDMMLGKKEPSQKSLVSYEQPALVVQPRSAASSTHSRKSLRPAGDRSRSASRSRSRSASRSRRRRSTSRSGEAPPQQELPPTLMPMPSAEDEEEVEDMFAVLVVAPKPKVLQQQERQQSTGSKKGRVPSKSREDRSGRKGRSIRKKEAAGSASPPPPQYSQRRSSLNMMSTTEKTRPKARRSTTMDGASKRRGSISARRRMMVPDNSSATNKTAISSNSRRRQSGNAADASQQPQLKRVDSSGRASALRRVDSSGGSRRRGSYRGLMSPEAIAGQLMGDEEDEKVVDEELANGLRRSQSRNSTRLNRRRSTTAAGGDVHQSISKSEATKISRRASCETAQAIRDRRMSHRDRIRRHLSCESSNNNNGMEGSADSMVEEDAVAITREDSRRERRKSALKGQRGHRRKITRSKSEPTERMQDILYADTDIDDDTVAALDYIAGKGSDDEEDGEQGSPKGVREMQRSDSTRAKTKKALERSEAANNAKFAKKASAAVVSSLKF